MGKSAGCRGARGCGFGGSRSHKHTPLSPPSGQRCLSLHSFPALAGSQISLRGRGREGGRKNRTQSQPGKEERMTKSWGGGRRKEGRRCGRGDIESQQDVISSASSQRGRDAAKGQALAIRLQSLSGTGYPGELARARGLDTGRQSQARRPPREGTQLCGSLASPAEGPGSPPNGISIW